MKLLSNRGTSMIVMLCPLFLCTLVTMSGVFLTLKTYRSVDHICQLRSLEMASETAKAIEDLIHLNPRAQNLRKQFERAKFLERRSRGVPPAHALAVANLLRVIRNQMVLRQLQLGLIARAESRVRYRELELRKLLEGSGAERITSYFPKMQVRPVQITSLTPDYLPHPLLSSVQMSKVSWRLNKQFWEPRFLQDLLPPSPEIKSHCESTVQERSHSWVATLVRVDKSLSNSL